MANKKRILITIENEYAEKLQEYAEKDHRSLPSFIAALAMKYIDDNEKDHQSEKG